jgi:hypothetical protein
MHPSELKNQALVAAAMAQREEARQLLPSPGTKMSRSQLRQLEAVH